MKNINGKTFINENLAPLLLLSFFITESIGKITNHFLDENSILPAVIKGLTLIFFSVFLLVTKNYKIKLLLSALFACFILGQLFTLKPFEFNIIKVFLKYLFPILLLFYFKESMPFKEHRSRLFTIYEYIILFNTFIIIIGFLFNITLFKTYLGERFGFNGLLINSSTSTYIYVVTLFYFLYKYRQNFIFKPKAIFILLGSLLIGTKTIYFVIFIILLYYLIEYTKSKKALIIISILLSSLLFFGYLNLFEFGIFNHIREKEGILTTLLSYRNNNLMVDTLPYIKNNWHVGNYLFGGINDFSLKSEMGFIDIVFFFGFFGAIIYLTTFIKVFLSFRLNKISSLFLLVMISIIFIAGNFFTYTNIAIYLLIIREFFKEEIQI